MEKEGRKIIKFMVKTEKYRKSLTSTKKLDSFTKEQRLFSLLQRYKFTFLINYFE